MQRFTYLLALVLMASAALTAQNQSFQGYIEAGDIATQKDDHYNAYRLYSVAAEEDWKGAGKYEERIPEVYYKAGKAAFKTAAFAEAEKYLGLLKGTEQMGQFPDAGYYLGSAQFRQGNYDAAVASLEMFTAGQPNADAAMLASAGAMIEDANWATDALSRADDTDIRHLGRPVNSDDSDVAYVRGPNNTFFYSSNQTEWKDDSLTPHRTISQLYKRSGADVSEALGAAINLPGKNVAHTAFTGDMSTVYYSVCDFRNYDQLRCDLYRASVDAEGNWSDPTMLDLNQAGAYTGQPSVGTEKGTGESYLYFSSDRPGGAGGMDLYRASLSAEGALGTPENLVGINTADDDVTPFWHEGRNTLFFATNGRFTFGGLDIYRASPAGDAWNEPVNLGSPINGPADDAYYAQFDEPEIAYMASRRRVDEALYYSDSQDVCCYDIYEFDPPTGIELRVLTFNRLTEEELDGTTVALYQMNDDEPRLLEELTNMEGNDFDFAVEPGGKYRLIGIKDGFSKALDEFDLSSPELVDEVSIVRNLYLAPAVRLDVFTFNSVDDTPLPATTVQLFELDDNGALSLVEEVINEEGNDSHFDLEIGKNYRVEGRKAGFGQAFTEVDLRDYDANSGSRTIRRDLYLGQALKVLVFDGLTKEPLNQATVRLDRSNGSNVSEDTNEAGNEFNYTVTLDQPYYAGATRSGYFPEQDTISYTEQDVINAGGTLVHRLYLYPHDPDLYLPFEVYFDNDYPDPDAYSTRTDKTYEQTYYPYLAQLPVFQDRAASDMERQEAFITQTNIEQFFEQEVEDGWRSLRYFTRAMLKRLESSGSYEVELAGFASPRAPTEYNRRLSARRNMSLENYFRRGSEGSLGRYLDNGSLTLSETALGETTARLAEIYERIDRERESIYSREASLERRVELIRPGTDPTRKR